MRYASILISFLVALGFIAAGEIILPKAWQSGQLLHDARDPVVQSEAALRVALTPQRLRAELVDSLDVDDVDMAGSFIELAQQEHIDVPKELQERYTRQTSTWSGIRRVILNGFIKGESKGATEMSGVIAADFVGFGDLRDLTTEALKPSPDPIVLGLAAAGLTVTALTVATVGGASPARIGVSTIKVAASAGRLSAPLATRLGPRAGGATRPRLRLDTGLDGRHSRSVPYPSAKSSESRGRDLRCPKTTTSPAAPKPRLA